jgi:uncharacterized protein involved in exopolysaccharide biosynthesis
LNEAKAKLDAQDAKLAQFKRQFLGSLPEEEQTNLSLLNGLNSQLEANTQALSRAEQDKAFNETLLSQQELNAKVVPSSGQTPNTTDQEIEALQKQLAALLAHYTSKHPDVVKLQNQIEELKKGRSQAAKTDLSENDNHAAPAAASPQTQQLRAKVKQDEISIADLTKAQGQIQEQIRQLQQRVQASPVVEQQLKELTRNYQTALDFYNDLLKKRDSSQLATDLEHQQESEQFSVFEPANLPEKPSSPNQVMLAGGGFAAGLALGLGLLYLIAYKDTSMHTERDVETCLKLAVLTMVPNLDDVEDAETGDAGPDNISMRLQKSA